MKLKRVFDIHAHIYPDAIASHAVRAISEAYDGVPIQNDGRLDTLISELDEAEIRAAAIHSVATTPHHAESINRYILGVAQAHPRRFVPFPSLHPDMPDLELSLIHILSSVAGETGRTAMRLLWQTESRPRCEDGSLFFLVFRNAPTYTRRGWLPDAIR